MNAARALRGVRVFQVAALLLNAAILVLDLIAGRLILALVAVILIGGLAVAIRTQTRTIRRREELDRPRPDYSLIAAMEREVFGETFKHDGAPEKAAWDTRPRRWDGRTTHPDTTEPATVQQYAAWLRGYVRRGGKPTHFYDYPISREGFRYAASTVTVDSDYEYGSSLRHIIVAAGVRTERTNPAGPFDGWAHTHMFFMHGYRTNRPTAVPVYSDPEFDEFRSGNPCDCDDYEHRPNLRWGDRS